MCDRIREVERKDEEVPQDPPILARERNSWGLGNRKRIISDFRPESKYGKSELISLGSTQISGVGHARQRRRSRFSWFERGVPTISGSDGYHLPRTPHNSALSLSLQVFSEPVQAPSSLFGDAPPSSEEVSPLLAPQDQEELEALCPEEIPAPAVSEALDLRTRIEERTELSDWLAEKLNKSESEVISLAVDTYVDYVSDIANVNIADIAHHGLKTNVANAVFETVLDDVFFALLVDYSLDRTETDWLSADPESDLQLQEKLEQIRSDPEFKDRDENNQQGFVEGFLECQKRAYNKVNAFIYSIKNTTKTALRKGAIGLFVNTVAFPLSPFVQAVLGKFTNWSLGLYESRAWQEWVADTPEKRAEMEYRFGYAEGEATCSRELLKLLGERQPTS